MDSIELSYRASINKGQTAVSEIAERIRLRTDRRRGGSANGVRKQVRSPVWSGREGKSRVVAAFDLRALDRKYEGVLALSRSKRTNRRFSQMETVGCRPILRGLERLINNYRGLAANGAHPRLHVSSVNCQIGGQKPVVSRQVPIITVD